jgi:hypothetical protein
MSVTKRLGWTFAAAGLLAACGDDPAEPPRVATSVVVNAGDQQTAQAGENVVAVPSVMVKDQKGKALAGVSVRFAVVEGGGTVDLPTVITDVQGIASAGRWVLGLLPGSNVLEATAEALPPVRFTATATSPFNVSVRYIVEPTASQRLAVDAAVARWRSVIIRDLSDIPMTAAAGSCFPNQPAVNENIDDLIIFVEFVPIDGVGQTLGQAGPCYIRSENDLPVIGYLKLDVADLERMEALGTLSDVVLHEMGHVIGIGSLWRTKNLLSGGGTNDPQFMGANAFSAYRELGGLLTAVPVENTGGAGTRDSHWRESVFRNELMTGFISTPPNPMSAMTVASLQDLGYTTNAGAASAFILTTGSILQSAPLMELEGSEQVISPRYRVDRTGTRRPMSFQNPNN